MLLQGEAQFRCFDMCATEFLRGDLAFFA